MTRKFCFVTLWLAILMISACGSNKKSGRDARREEIRNNAEAKRKELSKVTGQYFGNLNSKGSESKGITLNLEIKDIPQDEEGEVDPIIVPTLSGFVKFNYGVKSGDDAEQITFKLTKANYDDKTRDVDLVASNESFKDILFSLNNEDGGVLFGNWSSPDISKSGEIKFEKSVASGGQANLLDYSAPTLAGEYQGYIVWEKKNLKQWATMTIASSLLPPDGISLQATVRVFLGELGSQEFVTYSYDDVQFNPIDGKLTIKHSNGSDITFAGTLSNGSFDGRWSNRYDGDAGDAKFQRGNAPGDQTGAEQAKKIEGDYLGFVYWDREKAYQHTMFTVVSTIDSDSQVRVSVSAKLIFGDLGSNEYMTYDFPSAKYNPWTHQLSLKRDDSEISFVGELTDGNVSGTWSSIYRGSMGEVDLSKVENIAPSSGYLGFSTLKGTYRGTLENTNPDSNLPERFQVSLITSRDLSQPNGILVTGNLRFYLGPFNSQEYIERGLTDIRFNFFTRELVASTGGEDKYTIIATVGTNSISGVLSHNALGEISNVEVTRQ